MLYLKGGDFSAQSCADAEFIVTTTGFSSAMFKRSYVRTKSDHYVRNKSEPEECFFRSIRRSGISVLIIDEAHHFAAPFGNALLRCLSAYSRFKIALTGTPLMNKPTEIPVLLRGVGVKGNLAREEFWTRGGGNISNQAINEFQRQILVVSKVSERPTNITVELLRPAWTQAERATYNSTREEIRQVASRRRRDSGNVLMSLFQRLMLMTAEHKKQALVTRSLDMIRSKGPLVIVSQYCTVLDKIALLLQEHSQVKPVLFTGKMTEKQRENSLKSFRAGSSNCFLLSLKAGSEGLDGLQFSSSQMILLSPTFTDAALTQASARIDRRGQQAEECDIRLLVLEGSIDQCLLEHGKQKTEALRLVIGTREVDRARSFSSYKETKGPLAMRIPPVQTSNE